MENYKRLQPFSKGLFTRLVEQKKWKYGLVPASELEIDYTTTLNPVHVQLGLEKGMELLYRSTNRVYGYFRITSCGHDGFYHYGAIKKSVNCVKCSQCFLLKLEKEADEKGLIHVKRVSPNISEYVRKICGHTLQINFSNVRLADTERQECQQCLDNRIQEEATAAGLQIIDKKHRMGFCWYKLQCGHVKEINPLHIPDGSYRCRVCQDEMYTMEAEAAGIEYLRDVKSKQHDFRVYKLKCGCIKNIAIACVRRNAFECKNHPDRKFGSNVSSNAYLVKFNFPDFSFVKVGRTLDLYGKSSRYARYGCDRSAVQPIVELSFISGENCHSFEKLVHSKFSNHKLLPNKVKQYLENGFTECYSTALLKDLLAEFDSVSDELLVNRVKYEVFLE